MFGLYPHCVFLQILFKKAKKGSEKPVLDCSSGLSCSTTSCLKLLQRQPAVVHPQLRAGGELCAGLCFAPSFFTGGSNLLQSIHTGLLLLSGPDLLANKAANPRSHHSRCARQCARWGGKTSAESLRAVVSFTEQQKSDTVLQRIIKQKKVATVLLKGHSCF